jgi:hypothetical protein
MFWVGVLILPVLHLLYFATAAVVYELLYKRVVRPVVKFDFLAAVVIWLMIMGMVICGEVEVLLFYLVVVCSCGIVGLLAIVFFCIYAKRAVEWLLKRVIGPFLWEPFIWLCDFNWQVYRRYYNRRHPLPDEECTIKGYNQLMVHSLFWLQSVVVALALHFGSGQAHPELWGLALSWIIWYGLALLLVSLVINLLINRHYDKLDKERYYELYPEKRPVKKLKIKKVKSKPYREPSRWAYWRYDFKEWRKATKEKVCPLVKFVD